MIIYHGLHPRLFSFGPFTCPSYKYKIKDIWNYRFHKTPTYEVIFIWKRKRSEAMPAIAHARQGQLRIQEGVSKHSKTTINTIFV